MGFRVAMALCASADRSGRLSPRTTKALPSFPISFSLGLAFSGPPTTYGMFQAGVYCLPRRLHSQPRGEDRGFECFPNEKIVESGKGKDNPGSSGSIDDYSTYRATRFSEAV